MVSIPRWYDLAKREINNHEEPGNRGPVVQKYVKWAHCGSEGEPWCAIFVNAMLELSGHTGTRSPAALSFANSRRFNRLAGSALGAIAVFWRQSPTSDLGHVGFCAGETQSGVMVLGGNENDAVRIEQYPRVHPHFGLLGYYWPVLAPPPTYPQHILDAHSLTPTFAADAPKVT